MADTLAFNAETHEYTLDGVSLPSVTRILKLTGISPSYADLDPFYAERGTAVHKACELDDLNRLDESTVDPEHVRPRLEAWRKFRREHGARFGPASIEHRFAYQNKYAGCVDRLYTRGGVLDIKTGKPAAWHGVQTMAYAVGAGQGREAPRWAIYLAEDGTYRLERHEDPSDFTTWASALAIMAYRRRCGMDWRS